MMTWVQTQKLRRDEASLMTEWQTRWAQSACFNADGVVDYERWSALPDRKHIVVLLKETNGLHGSLVEFLYHGGSKTYYRTWNNVARWANMILNGTYDAEWIRPHEETALWYYKSSLVCTGKETLVVSMPHPNRAAKNWTLELEKVLRAIGRL